MKKSNLTHFGDVIILHFASNKNFKLIEEQS